MSELEKWILGIGAMVIGGLIVAFWKHVIEDVKTRERVAALETDNTTTKKELNGLRERFHDFRDDTMQRAWELFHKMKDESVATFEKWKVEILDSVRRRDRDDR